MRTSIKNSLIAFIYLFTVKKLPDFLLKVMVSRTEYKSCDIAEWVDNYLITFLLGFAEIFSLTPEEITVEMFAYFISLRFPPEKVKKIVSILYKDETLSFDDFDNISKLIKTKSKHNKCNLIELYQINLAFMLMINRYDIYYSLLDQSKQYKFKNFYKKLTGKEII